MWTTTPLSEYLLSYRDESGGPIVSLGITRYTIPIFPPGYTAAFSIGPRTGAFADILIVGGWSPSTVPDAFTYDAFHEGVQLQTGLLSTLMLSQAHSMWLVLTEKNVVISNITNVTNIPQRFESLDVTLIVPSEESLKRVFALARQWGGYESSRLLANMQPGTPRPPIGGIR